MNNILKALIPVGIGFCLGRTRVLIKNKNSEKKFEAHVDLGTPMFITESSAHNAITKLEERVSEIETFYNIGVINSNDVEVI